MYKAIRKVHLEEVPQPQVLGTYHHHKLANYLQVLGPDPPGRYETL